MVSPPAVTSYHRLLCWGVGAVAVGRRHPWDRFTCAWCGRRLRKADPPVHYDDGRVSCGDCARTRHNACILEPAA